MGKRKKWTAKPFESVGQRFQDDNGTIRSDSSANLYESMLLHPAFATMKPRQKMLYIYCKAQYFGKRKPQDDYKELEEAKGNEKFYMNRASIVKYGLYTKNGMHEFYSDLKLLQERGFIRCISNGRSTKSKSIYEFSDQWKYWTPEKS